MTELHGQSLTGAGTYERLEALMKWPRTLGAPERQHSIEQLAGELAASGADVHVDSFVAEDVVDGRSYALANVLGLLRPKQPPRFVLATHFDTRPWADEDPDPEFHDRPVPGANDGTSGVAVVLELAAALDRELPADVGFAVVLFDGEELGHPGRLDGYCAGSRRFAASAAQPDEQPAVIQAILKHASFGIVFDMVGDVDLRIAIEGHSAQHHPELVENLWSTAEALRKPAFVRAPGQHILDDHVFLTRAGIPSVLLIDLEYAPWHTHGDTLERVAPESLAQVQDVVFHALIRRFAAEGAAAELPGRARHRESGR